LLGKELDPDTWAKIEAKARQGLKAQATKPRRKRSKTGKSNSKSGNHEFPKGIEASPCELDNLRLTYSIDFQRDA